MKTLFLDVDTQNDFVLPAGALYAPGAERVIPVVAKLNRFAMEKDSALISTACLHAENDPEFRTWPPHCIAGTIGQLKPQATLVGQTIFTKQTTDVFLNPDWLPLLHQLGAERYVVYGVVTEVCVRFACEGLLRMGAPVSVVSDAICSLNNEHADAFLQDIQSRGGTVLSSLQILG